ncbi:chromosomal replication initiator protein DnaA [Thermodesulfobacterium sp. TA1]|uniref:chromosomal replication initiator protein DnaA n=1 Tax=Thermodesulfobacterium sp. TA1 TaxID=2234087 RepID=UPI001231F8F7|nr:chromosomal replication initiator protein DnaA [Thermodesulfobacterium sp. TA1]QER42209.1 chromosomal replication initiator protein DnaA [Thermodesulfobacterium sp. TA1]
MSVSWSLVKGRIKELLPEPIFKVWFEANKGEVVDGKLILEVPNEFTKNWIEENYANLLNQVVAEYELIGYSFIVRENPKAEQLIIPYNPISLIGRKLSPKYTFEDFVVGKCNEFAYNVCYQVADERPKGYLIYLYGNFGLGKTHLTQAVGNTLFSRGFDRVYYLTAQDFLNYMVKYLRSGMIENFKENFKEYCEVLLLEGIHFFVGKEYTQNELTFLLDYLLDQGKTVIFTSHKMPQELNNIDSSLRSRLNSALIIKLNAPDFQTRKKIIRHKAKKLGYNIGYEVVEYLARKVRGDVRQIESVVLGLIARASLLKEPISLTLAKELIEEIGLKDTSDSVDFVIETTCKFFGIGREDFFSSSRRKDLSLSRQVVIYLLRNVLKKSLKDISKIFKKQHSTIIYNLKTFEQKVQRDVSLRTRLDYLIKEINLELNDKVWEPELGSSDEILL